MTPSNSSNVPCCVRNISSRHAISIFSANPSRSTRFRRWRCRAHLPVLTCNTLSYGLPSSAKLGTLCYSSSPFCTWRTSSTGLSGQAYRSHRTPAAVARPNTPPAHITGSALAATSGFPATSPGVPTLICLVAPAQRCHFALGTPNAA
eukprot:1184778-Prorocentrum_minimum.AAC.2